MAAVLDALPGEVVEDAVSHAAERVVSSPQGDGPHTIVPTIPVVAVTGTNGKTTTSRMIAHIARTAGQVVGWSNTDGIYLDGELVEAGDYSGPSGAGRVLDLPGVEFAVTETARGGILLKGIGLTRNDVSVVTNVSADHLGVQGIDTLDQLAEVKAVVPADHPAPRLGGAERRRPTRLSRCGTSSAPVRGSSPATRTRRPMRETLDVAAAPPPSSTAGCRCSGRTATRTRWSSSSEVPMTLGGLSRFNVENTLAAASAALAAGIPRRDRDRGSDVVPTGRRAQPGPDEHLHRPGRRRRGVGGHRPRTQRGGTRGAGRDHGRDPAARVAAAARPRRRRATGPTTCIGRLGEIGAMGADVVAIAHKEKLPARAHPRRARGPAPRRRRAGRGHRRHGVPDRGGLPRGARRPSPRGRRRRADVPRAARGGLRLDRRSTAAAPTPRTGSGEKVRAARL